MWITSSNDEPGSSVMRIVCSLPAIVHGVTVGAGGHGVVAARRLVHWTRRVGEAAVILGRLGDGF